MTSTFLKTVDFFVPVLEPQPGYIRGVLKDAFTSIAIVTAGFVFTGYLDKAISADLGVYNWAQGYDVENGGVTYVAQPLPVPEAVPLALPPVTELLELPDEPIVIPPINRVFHDVVLCSVNTQVEPADAFLFDALQDLHINHPAAQITGEVVFEAFNTARIENTEYGEPSSEVIGHCQFYINDGEKRTHYVADAFPDTVAGTRQQLLDPALVPP